MELIGKIKKILETQTFDSGFKKREMVLTTQENYPQDILIEFLQDKTNLLDTQNEGNEVKVSINIRGREWVNPQGETKYFNSIVGWRIENIQQGAPAGYETPPAPPKVENFPQDTQVLDEEDDLPF